ncbi:MAG: hypothetical protein KGI89_17455, partial [Euryarchaeota archaeon]|nr:hypothetical protein [Euryarchaeota archaeon]
MIPRFSAIKNGLSGNGADVRPETGEYLGLAVLSTLVLLTVVPKLIHRRKGRPHPRKEGLVGTRRAPTTSRSTSRV